MNRFWQVFKLSDGKSAVNEPPEPKSVEESANGATEETNAYFFVYEGGVLKHAALPAICRGWRDL